MNPNESNKTEQIDVPKKKNGGLYSKVNMSLRTANLMVLIGILLLVAVTAFLIKHNGFTVRFDTDGGSYVESQKVLHSETISVPENPVREGYTFDGWYLDRDHTVRFDPSVDTVTQSMTLYAAWKQH